jgi:hypothetical protein
MATLFFIAGALLIILGGATLLYTRTGAEGVHGPSGEHGPAASPYLDSYEFAEGAYRVMRFPGKDDVWVTSNGRLWSKRVVNGKVWFHRENSRWMLPYDYYAHRGVPHDKWLAAHTAYLQAYDDADAKGLILSKEEQREIEARTFGALPKGEFRRNG